LLEEIIFVRRAGRRRRRRRRRRRERRRRCKKINCEAQLSPSPFVIRSYVARGV